MNGILKGEFLLDSGLSNFEQALALTKNAIFNYNCLRIHGQLNGKTPEEVHTGFASGFQLWAQDLLITVGLPQQQMVNAI